MNLKDFLADVRESHPEVDWDRSRHMLDVVALADVYHVARTEDGHCVMAIVVDRDYDPDGHLTAFYLTVGEDDADPVRVYDRSTADCYPEDFLRKFVEAGYRPGGCDCERAAQVYEPDVLLPYEAHALETVARRITERLRQPCDNRAAAALRLSIAAGRLEDAAEVLREGARRMAELDLERYDGRTCNLAFDANSVVKGR